MNFTKHTLILSVLAISLVAAACSSDDSNNAPAGFNSGLPADKQVGDLTADEITTLNEAGADYAEQASSDMTPEQGCQPGAVTAGLSSLTTTAAPTDESVQQACTDSLEACVASGNTFTMTSQTVTQAQLTGCTATVGEMETCFTEITAAGATSLKSTPACSSLTVAGAATTAADLGKFVYPESCTALYKKCPGLAGTTP